MECFFLRFIVALAMSGCIFAYVDIPEGLKRGKMKQYASCRKLFSQTEESSASTEETVVNFKKTCTCSFYQEHPHSRLGIDCRNARVVSLPVSEESYRSFGDRISHFVAKQRLRGTTGGWQEKRVGFTENPEAIFELELASRGQDNVYEIEIQAILRNGSRSTIMSDHISSNSGRSVAPQPPDDETVESRRETARFSLTFDKITDNSISLTFTTQTPSVFRTQYYAHGEQRREVNFDVNGQATITGLQSNTKHTLIISHYRDGAWTEIKRKGVRTREVGSGIVSIISPPKSKTRDFTFDCPVPTDIRLQNVRWYKRSEGEGPQLLATYDAVTGRTVYARPRNLNVKVTNGVVLKIKNAKRGSTDRYNCRYSAMRPGTTAETELGTDDDTGHGRLNDACAGYDCGRGRCTATPSPTCVCDRGFTGDRCDIAVNYCDSTPCASRGICNPFPGGYACQCSRGYTGINCERSSCPSNFCLNEGLCEVRSDGGFDCSCSSGFRGPRCQERIVSRSPCDARPCVHGTCIALARNFYHCKCDRGYTGKNCQNPLNPRVGPTQQKILNTSTTTTTTTTTRATTAATVSSIVTSVNQTEEHRADSMSTTLTTTTLPTVVLRPSSGGQAGKYTEQIRVAVYGPTSPVKVGNTAYLICVYPTFGSTRPTITWKRGNEVLYSQKMPVRPSRDRITMTNQRQLRINRFQQSDAGAYECAVAFETDASIKAGKASLEVNAVGAPDVPIPPPTDLVVNVTGPNTATVTWRPPIFSGVTKYIVRYYPTTRSFGVYESREVTVPQIALYNLEENNEYNIAVVAANDRRNSEPLRGYFEQVVEKISAPTYFNAQMLSLTQAKVSWSESEGDGISGYKVRYWDVAKPAQGNLVEKVTKLTEIILSGLTDGATYQVWIRAMKGKSLSPPLSSQFTKTPPPPPNAPDTLEFTNVEKEEITVRWDAPAGWRTSDKFRVAVESLNEEHPLSQLYEDVAERNVTASGLHPGVPYLFTVNTVRNGVQSSPVKGKASTADVIYLAAPYPTEVTLQCKPMLSTRIYRVKWYKVDKSGKQLILTALSTFARNESMANDENEQFAGRLNVTSITSLTITDVRYPEDFGKYECDAAAAGQFTGSHSTELLFKYPLRIAPPFRFEFVFISDSSAKITWRHPYAEDITRFAVRFWPTSIRYGPERSLEAPGTEAVLSNLTVGTEYQVVVKAKVTDMISDDSLVGQFINFGQHVTNVRVERVQNSDDLRISWENPEGMDGTLFSLRDSENQPWNIQPPMSPDRNSKRIRYPMNVGDKVFFKISTLKNNIPTPVVVEYTEKEIVDVEETEESPDVLLPENDPSVPELGPPSPVSNLRVNVLSPSSLTAVWESSPDVYFDSYRVVVSNLRYGEYEIFDVSRSYLHVTRLRPYQEYRVTVQTVRNGSFSDPLSATASLGNSVDEAESSKEIAEAVPRPTNLRFYGVRKYRFTVSWDSPGNNVVSSEVRYKPTSTNAQWTVVQTGGKTRTELKNLKSGTEYDVEVYSISLSGKSQPASGRQSTFVDKRVKARKPPSPVVSVAGKTTYSITLSWNAQNTDYLVRVKPAQGSGRKQTLNLPRGSNSIEVSGLLAGRKYRAVVNAVKAGVKSPPSIVFATTIPAQPENVRAIKSGPNSLLVSWTPSTSMLLTGHKVTFSSVERMNEAKVIETSSNQVQLTELEPETVYSIFVEAVQGEDLSESVNLRVLV